MICTLPGFRILATASGRRKEGARFRFKRTLAHNFVDLSVLLPADKFLMFTCQLDFNSHLILRLVHKGYLVDNKQCSFYAVIRSINGEGQFIKADISTTVHAHIGKHSPNIRRRWGSEGIRRVRVW